jgi:hypothetical protein
LLLILLTSYGILNSILYCSLMPLWEGLDEPFHYGYVETLSVHERFPVFGRTTLSAEIWESLHIGPVSHTVKQNLPFATTFSQFFSLPEAERTSRCASLISLPVPLRGQDSLQGNYEAQQAPLAYLMLAVPDAVMHDAPLRRRIFWLRLIGAISACLMEIAAIWQLVQLFHLPPALGYAALFFVLSCQMFYAAIGHISNDWLAIPLTTWLLVSLARLQHEPGKRNALLTGCLLTAGLLTKAYFLFWLCFVVFCVGLRALRARIALRPVLFLLAPVMIIAGPWYVRNVLLYGTVAGVFTMQTGPSSDRILRALLALDWLKVFICSARSALWTGNNSFLRFSAGTLNVILSLILLGALLWLCGLKRRAPAGAEVLVAVACVSFLPVLAWSCAALFAFSANPAAYIAPWYTQALAAPVACLICAGFGRWGKGGLLLAASLCVAFSYLLVATYLLKLLPLYAGYPHHRTPVRLVWHWYLHDWAEAYGNLAQVALGNPMLVVVLVAAVSFLSVALAGVICCRLARESQRSSNRGFKAAILSRCCRASEERPSAS